MKYSLLTIIGMMSIILSACKVINPNPLMEGTELIYITSPKGSTSNTTFI